MNDKLLYRVPEVVSILSVSRSKVYELLASGELPSVHIDRVRLVRRDDLTKYEDMCRVRLAHDDEPSSIKSVAPDAPVAHDESAARIGDTIPPG